MLQMSLLAALLSAPAQAAIPAAYGVISHRVTASVVEGTSPVLTITAKEAEVVLVVQCTAAEQTIEWETGVVPKGEERSFALDFTDEDVRAAECGVFARMANGLAERKTISAAWTVTPPQPDAPAPEPPENLVPPKNASGAP